MNPAQGVGWLLKVNATPGCVSSQDEHQNPMFSVPPPSTKSDALTSVCFVGQCLTNSQAQEPAIPGTVIGCRPQAPQALGKVQVPYTPPVDGEGGDRAQVACCLATRIEPLGSFSGQSCPSHTRSSQSSCEKRANIY